MDDDVVDDEYNYYGEFDRTTGQMNFDNEECRQRHEQNKANLN